MFNVVPVFSNTTFDSQKNPKTADSTWFISKVEYYEIGWFVKNLHNENSRCIYHCINFGESDSCHKIGNVEALLMSQSSLSSSMGSSPKRCRRRFSRLRSLAL